MLPVKLITDFVAKIFYGEGFLNKDGLVTSTIRMGRSRLQIGGLFSHAKRAGTEGPAISWSLPVCMGVLKLQSNPKI